MKKLYTILAITAFSTSVLAQQPNNSGFENWENVGTDIEEPTNWSGMMTGDLCTFCAFGASQRVFREDSEVYSGSYSARIESTNAIGGIVVNGTITTGRVTAPSTTPSDGYNQTLTGTSDFNHPFTYEPDSLVFWAKYNLTNNSDSARVSFVLHDAYDVRDPQDGGSAPHVVASARKNFQTNNEWQRISIPFIYDGQSSDPVAHLLATFTASYQPGAGNSNAELYVDEVSFVYNTVTGVEQPVASLSVYPNPSLDGRFNLDFGGLNGQVDLVVYDMYGRTIQTETVLGGANSTLEIAAGKGVYMLIARNGTKSITNRLIIQ